MGNFTPKVVICNLVKDSFMYRCKATHLNEQGSSVSNSYLFTGKPLKYLVKVKEDYNEMIKLNIFEDYVEEDGETVSQKSETTKERKLRERAEAKSNKEAVKKNKNLGGDKMEDTEKAPEEKPEEKPEEEKEESTEEAKDNSEEAE